MAADIENKLAEIVNREDLYAYLKQLGDVHCPSQTLRYTRIPKIREMMSNEISDSSVGFDDNWQGTGNGLLSLNKEMSDLLVFHHADQFSYLVNSASGNEVLLTPYCAHRSATGVPVIAMRFDGEQNRYILVGKGTVHVKQDSVYAEIEEGSVQRGDRLVIDQPIELEGDVLSGALDNTVGVVCGMLLVKVLVSCGYKGNVSFIYTDEDNGPPDESIQFCRGAQRIAYNLTKEEIRSINNIIVIDSQEAFQTSSKVTGGMFTERVSNCHGSVMPPHNYQWLRSRAEQFKEKGIQLVENTSYVSRGDDTVAYKITPNVYPIGYPAQNVFFASKASTVNIDDIVHLTKALFWLIWEGFPDHLGNNG